MALISSTPVLHVVDAVNSFQESAWIGVGKKYQDVPPEVSDERNKILWIPESHFRHYFPAFDNNVTHLIASKVPELSNNIQEMKTSIWFSKDTPTTDPDCLRMRHVPPEKVITRLLSVFGQQWLDGANSIVDPRFNDGRDRLPLWTIRFWKKMAEVISDRDKWAKGYQWLGKQREIKHDKETIVAVEEALQTLGTIHWRKKLKYCRGTVDTRCLTALLGNDWLSDDHINVMMEEYSFAVEGDASLKDRVIVAPVQFSDEIRKNGDTGIYEKKKGAGLLLRYEYQIKEKRIEKILFPVHVNGNHWVAAFVDFKSKKIGYGDSLIHLASEAPLRRFMPQLRRWLEVRFGLDPEDQGDIMPHGKQMDTFNCGITMANTIGHHLFKKPLWTPDRAILERVQWFLHIFRAMSPAEGTVSTPTNSHINIHPQAEKLPVEDLIMDVEIGSSGHQIVDEEQLDHQDRDLRVGLEMSQLQRRIKSLIEERDQALEEGHRLRSLIPERGPKSFGWGTPSDHAEEVSDSHHHSPLGAQKNTHGENPNYVAWLGEALAARISLFEQEKNRREELESEVAVLKSELGKAHLYSHLRSEYRAFAREVRTTAYALEGVEASVRRETNFACEDFHTIIRSLSVASTEAKKLVSTIEDGKFNIAGFIEADDSNHESECEK